MFMWLTEYQWALNYAKWMKGNKRVNREQRLAKKIPRRILHGALALPVTDRRERRGKKWADFDFQLQVKFGDNPGFLTRFLHIPFLTRNAIQYLKKHRGGNLWWTWRANHSNNHPIYQFLLLFPFFKILLFFFVNSENVATKWHCWLDDDIYPLFPLKVIWHEAIEYNENK